MSQTLSTNQARGKLTEVAGRVQRTGERIMTQKHGKPVAALVALEGRLDLLAALDALADYRTNGGTSLEALKVALGI